MARKKERWIQKAIKKKGALTAYVKRKYGMAGFTISPKTKLSILFTLRLQAQTPGFRREDPKMVVFLLGSYQPPLLELLQLFC